MAKKEKYQCKCETLANAKSDAKSMSKVYSGEPYWIIESVDKENKKMFFVENESGFTRGWETNHGYYLNGKYHKE